MIGCARELAGWGRFPRADCSVVTPRSVDQLAALKGPRPLIARGLGRSYGDSALNPTTTVDMTRLNRMLSFDETQARLTVEAGVVLGDIIEAFLPRGWFLPVTPGTKFVTVGGMIAADVHGKNHHKHGSFGGFVDWIDVLGPEGTITRCSRDEHRACFAYTIGGMGLTGLVVRAAFRLIPVETAWIRQKTLAAPSLSETMALLEAKRDWTYSVAWVDCLAPGGRLGRSLLHLGEHARRDELNEARRREPFQTPGRQTRQVRIALPGWAMRRWPARCFNSLYYRQAGRAPSVLLVDWDRYFYPLDAVRNWNRLYGRRGLMQFQCVLPLESSSAGMATLLEAVRDSGQVCFLAVLKRMGMQESKFSFPMEGFTLALDFPVKRTTLALLERLDAIVIDYGGRFYLAKDARMSKATLERSDKRVAAFRAMRTESGAVRTFTSLQSERLAL